MKDIIIYISEFQNIILEEKADIIKIEGDKVYCVDEYKNYLIFNKNTGYCYTDNNTFGAKKYLKK